MPLIISSLLFFTFRSHHFPLFKSFASLPLNPLLPHPSPLIPSLTLFFPLIPLSECASDGPFLSNPVHIDPYGSSTQGEGCEDHCYSVLNATNALDVGPETRLPGRALSIAAVSCQQQPNGLSICDLRWSTDWSTGTAIDAPQKYRENLNRRKARTKQKMK